MNDVEWANQDSLIGDTVHKYLMITSLYNKMLDIYVNTYKRSQPC